MSQILLLKIQIIVLIIYIMCFIISVLKRSLLFYKSIKIDKNDENKFKYFRDILKDYSISELGYLFNKRNITQIKMAELEYLKDKKYISFAKDEINVINNVSVNQEQSYILNHYKFINDKDFDKYYIKEIENSLKQKNCIKKYYFKDNPFTTMIYFLAFIIFGGIWFYFITIHSNYLKQEIILFILFWIISFIMIRFSLKEASLVKTEKGKEIYLKLKGLKNYLKDFGNFNDKSLKEISLWNEYILYAIILNESSSLSVEAKEELNKLISIIYKK